MTFSPLLFGNAEIYHYHISASLPEIRMTLLSMTLSLFLIMNSVGHIRGYLDLVSALSQKKRAFIIVREMIFALLLMALFIFVGDLLLDALDVNEQTIMLAGGLILFLIAIRMIFPAKKTQVHAKNQEEPFFFPIATPMIAGPSCLTTIMLYAHEQNSSVQVLYAVLIAWALTITILLFAHPISEVIGKRALLAAERLMGLLLTMMAVEMLLKGVKSIALEGIK
ncbi:MAG TPA: MarC family protein [Myxococcota bacterium]|nr:MarC family protein [Myxococcota bacterium]